MIYKSAIGRTKIYTCIWNTIIFSWFEMSCITKLVLRHDYAFVAICISTIVIKAIHSIVNINNSL